MSDFLFLKYRRNNLSSLLHIVLNILLAIFSILIPVFTGNYLFGLILVVISKWRIFAIHPRFWWTNLKLNAVDLMVGFSFLLLSKPLVNNVVPIINYVLIIAYASWLIFLKPKDSPLATRLQCYTAMLLGLSAATTHLYELKPNIIFISVSFLIIYSSIRHVLSQLSALHAVFFSLVVSALNLQLIWLLSHWLIIYSFGPTGASQNTISLPQISIASVLFTHVILDILLPAIAPASTPYSKNKNYQLSIIFSTVIILIMLLLFSNPIFNI